MGFKKVYYIEIIDPCDGHMDGCSCNEPNEYKVVQKLESPKFSSYKKATDFIKTLEKK